MFASLQRCVHLSAAIRDGADAQLAMRCATGGGWPIGSGRRGCSQGPQLDFSPSHGHKACRPSTTRKGARYLVE